MARHHVLCWRHAVAVLVVLVGAQASCPVSPVHATAAPPQPAQRRNVLLLCIDDLRPEIGAFHPWSPDDTIVTPNLDALAERGTLFERPIVQLAVCGPSRTSFLTSLNPGKTRVFTIGPFFRNYTATGRDAVTMPEAFLRAGYTTESYGKVFHVSPECYTGPGGTPIYTGSKPCLNDPQSWSSPAYFPVPYWERGNASTWDHGTPNGLYNPADDSWAAAHEHGGSPEYGPLPDELITAQAVRAVKRLAADAKAAPHGKPFFLAAGFLKPHLPQVFRDSALAPYRQPNVSAPSLPTNPHPPVGSPKMAWGSMLQEIGEYTNVKHWLAGNYTPRPLPDDMARAQKLAYHAAATFTDMQVGAVLSALDESGVANDTIVVLISDHGWKLGEHGGWAKKTNFMYDVRGLLIVADPAQREKGTRATSLVEYVDLMPTLMELAGVGPAPTPIDGTSFAPLLDDPGAAHKAAAFAQYPSAPEADNVTHMGYSIITDAWRLTLWVWFPKAQWYNTSFIPDFGTVAATELYDQVADPNENVNVAALHADVVAVLEPHLRAHVMASFPTPPPLSPTP